MLDAFDEPSGFDSTQPESAANRNPCSPDDVARVVESVLDAADPPLRTLVGTRWEGNRVLDSLVDRIAEANACPSLNYPTEELVGRLRARLLRLNVQAGDGAAVAAIRDDVLGLVRGRSSRRGMTRTDQSDR